MSRLTRKEMKRDEVREVLTSTMQWLGGHAKGIGLAIAAVVGLIIAVTLTMNLIGGRQDEASDALGEALEVQNAPLGSDLSAGVVPDSMVFDSQADRLIETKRRFEELSTGHPRSRAARIARAYVAKMELESGREDVARTLWTELADSGDDDALTAQVVLNLVALDRQQGRSEEAETRLLGMVDSPKSPLPQSLVLYELALTQGALGKAEESRSTYQRVVDEHPTSPQARAAAEKASAT